MITLYSTIWADRVTYLKRMDISAIPAAQTLLRDTMRGVVMKRIPLTQGKFAIVDDEDYEIVSKHKWRLQRKEHTCYAFTHIRKNSERTTVSMHRLIMNAKTGQQIDHKDGNGINDKKENLRFSTQSQNCMNRRSVTHTSIYKGVGWNRLGRKWRAAIMINHRSIHLGYFKNEVEAAKAYDIKAKKLFGEFAYTNF